MPRPLQTPSPTGTASTWQIGTYNAVSDTFTPVLDLNDRVTWFVKSYDLPQPEKVVSRSGNPRTNGERITNERYKNRYITLTLQLRSTTTLAAIDTAIHALEAAIDNTPFMLRIAEAQAAQYSYAIVKSWVHNIPQDPLQRLAKVKVGITIIFECEPGLLGDKLYLDNLVVNPGFEAPSGPGVTVFTDSFANTNAYALQSGSAPTLAANVMTVAVSSRIAFGSPSWGPYNTWQVRFQFATSMQGIFYLHYVDGNNYLRLVVGSGNMFFQHNIAGTSTTLATVAPTLTASNWYWVRITQFPTVPGETPMVQALLFNDSAGAIGSAVTNGALGPVSTHDAVTALIGRPQLSAGGAAMNVGGNFANVHTVSLFGPGGWLFSPNFSAQTGQASGAWEQSTANTYTGGPVTSYGAGRIDLPPAGTVDARWQTWDGTGGSAGAAQFAYPTAQNHVLGFSAAYKTTAGLSATSFVRVAFREVDSTGAQLVANFLTILSGTTQTTWASFSGTYTVTQASCAYVYIQLQVMDSTANSANATVWFDNVQLWDQTALNGQTSMPYCELRFPQAPAQLLVSGLVGDLVVPATLAFATYVGGSLTSPFSFLIGRRAYATSGAQLVAPLVDQDYATAQICVLDATSYGGMYMKWTPINSTDNNFPIAFSGRPADYQGFASLLVRLQSSETTGTNIGKVTVAALETTHDGAFDQGSSIFDAYMTAAVAGLTTQNAWAIVNAGLLPIPGFARSAATDLTQNYVSISPSIIDANTTPVAMQLGWCALLPNDATTTRGQIIYGGVGANLLNHWNWYYLDANPISNGGIVPTTGFSTETAALANIAHATGGSGQPPNSAPVGAVSVIPTGDAYLTLDPSPPTNALSVSGVNQLVAVLTDGNTAVVNFVATLSYTPQYLDPR